MEGRMNRKIVCKLRLPMPLVDLRPLVRVIEKAYGQTYVGADDPTMYEDGWLCIWAPDPPEKPKPRRKRS